ncbi:hypothetical protein HaLaN_05989 [Haematococcus lacustris]|uniref:Uncharacterized protein n=1 Tax=Haematococcus lacustris TaxID=44745 RepID=A0A699YKP1_HAELA|nr:hypothetical protein HaLaN_05989 [Haematococcus lacustris]
MSRASALPALASKPSPRMAIKINFIGTSARSRRRNMRGCSGAGEQCCSTCQAGAADEGCSGGWGRAVVTPGVLLCPSPEPRVPSGFNSPKVGMKCRAMMAPYSTATCASRQGQPGLQCSSAVHGTHACKLMPVKW